MRASRQNSLSRFVSLTRLPAMVSSTSDSLSGILIARVAGMTRGSARDVRRDDSVEKCWDGAVQEQRRNADNYTDFTETAGSLRVGAEISPPEHRRFVGRGWIGRMRLCVELDPERSRSGRFRFDRRSRSAFRRSGQPLVASSLLARLFRLIPQLHDVALREEDSLEHFTPLRLLAEE